MDKKKQKDTILEITQFDKASQRRERKEKPCTPSEAEALPANEPAAVAYTYKDRIFRMIFKDKKEFLGLYNAMNDSDHDNPDDLTVTTLDNAIYMGMRNDVSFVLYDKLMLREHQSTKNPNIPLRNLFYVSDIYSKLTKDENLFGTLHDYTVFVDFVRRYQKRMPLESAVERAIHECIAADVLADFLKENRAEVVKMGLYEYDEEKFLRMEREYFREVGQQEGKLYSLTPIVRKMYRKGRALEVIADELDLALDEIRPIYELIAENPKMTDDEIVKALSPEPEDLY